MGESIVGMTSTRSIKRSTFLYALVACITAAIIIAIGLNGLTDVPLISQAFETIQNITGKIANILPFNPMLVLLFITVATMALKLKKKTKNSETLGKTAFLYYKPKKTLKVKNPAEQRVKIVASAPPQYLSELVKQVYTETNEVYGEVPLWVRYNMNTLGYSWSLNNVKASHDIYIYGESTYVQRFLTRINEELQTLQKNASTNLTIHSVEPETATSKIGESDQDEQPYPKEIKSAVKGHDFNLISGLAFFAVALLTLFANNIWMKKRVADNSSSAVDEGKALQNALEAIRELGFENQELKAQRKCEDGWAFQFSDYEIFVNHQGMVTGVRRNA
jgi:hypothetical protein